MKTKTSKKLKDGDQCKVVGGTHAGKSGTVRDINTSKKVILPLQLCKRMETLGKNVVVQTGRKI